MIKTISINKTVLKKTWNTKYIGKTHSTELCSWSWNMLCVCDPQLPPHLMDELLLVCTVFLLEVYSMWLPPHTHTVLKQHVQRAREGWPKGAGVSSQHSAPFGIGGRTNLFIINNSRAPPVPGTCAVLSSCVSREPLCHRKSVPSVCPITFSSESTGVL